MKDLAKRVAELFSPKPWRHGFQDVPGHLDGEHRQKCICGMTTDSHKTYTELSRQVVELRKTPCPIPDPIDITDLGKALEALREFKLPTLLLVDIKGVFEFYPYKVPEVGNKSDCFKTWLIYDATAEQLFEICCLAKESEK